MGPGVIDFNKQARFIRIFETGLFLFLNKKNAKLPKTFTETYNAESKVIDKENFREFIKIS